MKKNYKKILTVSSALILFIAGGLFFLAYKTKTQIREILTETFEQNLDSADINLSFFHRFPHPYLCVKNLKVGHHSDGLDLEILSVKEMDAEVNFLKLLKGDYEIKSVNFRDAELWFYADSVGKNIRLFKYKERDPSAKPGHFLLKLPKLSFENIRLKGQNEFKKSEWEINLNNADFQGVVKNGIVELTGNADGILNEFLKNEKSILNDKPLKLATEIEINPIEKATAFRNGKLNFAGADFEFEGDLKSEYPMGNFLDFRLWAENEFEALFGFFPEDVRTKFKQVNKAAESKIELEISGLAGGQNNPQTNAFFEIKNAAIISTEVDAKLDSLNFEIEYSNGENQNAETSKLTINQLTGKLKDNPVKLDLKVENFENPNVEADFDFRMDLEDLTTFFPIPNIQKMGGELDLKGSVKGQPKDENNWETRLEGFLILDDNDLKIDGFKYDFRDLTGRIEIRDSLMFFQNLKGRVTGIPFNLSGEIENSYRLIQNNRKDFEFDLKIYSHSINLNKVFNEISKTGKKVNKGDHPLNFPKYFDGKIQLNTPRLKYRDAVAQRFSSTILIKNGDIIIPKLSTDVLHGHFALDAEIRKSGRQNFTIYSNIKLGNLNTKRLLEIFKDFDQKVLTSKQVEGRLSGDIQLNAVVDSDLNLPADYISYVGEFSLKKAELIDFEPIVKALRHVKKKEASHVHIDNLKGKALYHRRQMYIPYLNFSSNLTTISLFGNRKPTEYMDFHVELSLGELLFKSKKRKEKERKGRVSKKDGKMDVRVNLAGMPGEMKVKTRSKKVFEETKRATNRAYTNVKRKHF